MIVRYALAAALAVAAATPAVAFQDAWESQVNELLDRAGQVLEGRFTPTGYQKSGSLDEDGDERTTVRIAGRGEYAIIGVCDGDCSDLDLEVYDASGDSLDSDYLEDDFPVLKFSAGSATSVSVQASMASCSAEPCRYGFRLYRQN